MKTLAQPSQFSQEIKRSRFLARAGRVDDLAQTLAFHEQAMDAGASHNCWAFKIGHQYRFSDDGEPASTAGRPILAAIEGQDLDHVMVLVSRYFGGIKLGVGGLIRAYGGITARCLQQAQIITEQAKTQLLLRLPFEYANALHQLLKQVQATKLSEQFLQSGAEYRLELPQANVAEMEQQLRELSRGQARLRKILPE